MKNRSKSKLRRKITPYLYLSPTIILMLVLMVVPIYLIIKYSFQNNAIVVADPEFVWLDNYKKILSDSEFWGAVKTTFVFVTVSVAAHIILGMCFALLLNTKYFKTRTKTIARVIYVLPWVFTASVIAILWKMMLQPAGIVDYILSIFNLAAKDTEWLSNKDVALATITLVNIWCGYPFYMISILAGLQGIPEDLYESSALDGATKWKSFLHIIIPQLKPILISIAMLDFVWTLQSFALIWMMTGGGPVNSTQTLSIYIYKLAFNSSQYGLASAVAVILLLLCVIVAIFYVKQQKKVRE
ncbi:MAG TPA: sugar ABC transporter permease [Lachnospiraceae bacterium]|nr:sugar ABC transporter permease [Muricomes intestini]HAX51691.1 sugar ABC transporter permease [Lachnospiraceae bacterium]